MTRAPERRAFVLDDILFAYREYVGEDHEADMQRIVDDPVAQERWLGRPR
ncbi:hypothetical protein [Kribbella sindirgiensis]|nr:hypothetical protein [Kribbella sindirgiensis]